MNLRDALTKLQAVAAPIPSTTGSQVPAELAVTPPDPDLCRYCGATIDWRRPEAVIFGDRAAAHLLCYEQAEATRVLDAAQRAAETPDGPTDPAELTVAAARVP